MASLARMPMRILSRMTKNDAYWAGFIYADGSLTTYEGRWFLSLTVAEKDADHLQILSLKYRNAIQRIMRSAIKGGPKFPSHTIRFSSRIEPSLSHWGIVRRKTYNWIQPSFPASLTKSFLRGWFDGDGCFSQNRAIVTNYSRKPLEWFSGKLIDLGYTGKVTFGTKNGGRHHCVKFSGTEFFDILKGSPRLIRKWEQRPAKLGLTNTEKTHCIRGHEFTEENTYRQLGRNSRSCLICRREQGTR